MGDSCPVLPVCASPNGPFLHARKVSCEKRRQSMETVVSIFKKFFKFPRLIDGSGKAFNFQSELRGDRWWFLFSAFPLCCMSMAFNILVGDIGFFIHSIVMNGGLIIHLFTLVSIVYWHRDKPYGLIGAKMKFMIEVIPMITAAALHHLLESDDGYLALQLGLSTYFYVYAHLLHEAYDIAVKDVFLGLVMQVFFYMLDGELLVRALALSFCVGLCFYRYMTYCAPEVPAHRKKEFEPEPV